MQSEPDDEMNKSNQRARDPQAGSKHLFYQPDLKEGINFLDHEEAHHAKVLRLSVGDNIVITNGRGLRATAKISSAGKSSFEFKTEQIQLETFGSAVHLLVAPTKNSDRMEWLVEKATEIGVHSIQFVKCEHSERKSINFDRLNKVAISAMKQSQRNFLLRITGPSPFNEVVLNSSDQKFIAFVDHANPEQLKHLAKPGKLQNYSILIGPEGDFTKDEIEQAIANGWSKVSLGPTRLRTETAALVGALTLVQLNT